ncbi:MAG: adenosine kinase, partial [Acidimicrobiaceae bacterium]|nr:adenosine kinase [Acidimicrobiaceae bacterium]
MPSPVEVVTLGHAIVDVLAPVPDHLVAGLGLAKGTMTLVDEEQSEQIYAKVGPATEVSGGSAANTAAGVAALGASAAFVGKVRDDQLGRVFAHDIRAAGVAFDVPAAPEGPPTGRCVIMVTPDAEKTMCTNLGIGDVLLPADLDEDLIARAGVLYIEGYVCGLEHTDATVDRALDVARSAGTRVALSLSDPLWVELHGPDMASLLDRVDLLFANEQEACGMTGAADVDAALAELAKRCPTVVVTLGAAGSIVAAAGEAFRVPAEPVPHVVDTTGAGDLFAAGFLYGECRGLGPEGSARLGALAAAEVVSHMGARPAAS